jgi:hypothetical protein
LHDDYRVVNHSKLHTNSIESALQIVVGSPCRSSRKKNGIRIQRTQHCCNSGFVELRNIHRVDIIIKYQLPDLIKCTKRNRWSRNPFGNMRSDEKTERQKK